LVTKIPAGVRQFVQPERGGVVGLIALAAIPVVLFLLGRLLSVEFEQSRLLQEQVDQSYRLRFEVQRTLSLHQDIETGQRGFVMTGDPEFLEPYRHARSRIGGAIANLAKAADRNPHIKRELPRLASLSDAKLRFSEETIQLRQSGRGEAAAAAIAGGRGKQLMDRIRGHVGQIDRYEQSRLKLVSSEAQDARRRSQRMTFLLLTTLAILLFAASLANRRSLRAKKETLRRLEDLTARQQAIFNSAKDGIITINRSGSIESLNPAAARMFGYEPEELARRDVGVLFEVAPDVGAIETFLERLQRRRGGEIGRIQEFWGRRKDGSTFPTDVAVSPVPLADGLRFVAIVRDATERKQIDQMKNEFVSTVSHELRTPLTSIAGSLGLLAGGAAGELPERGARLIKIAHSNSERLVRLINDILDIEKIESGKMNFDMKPVALLPLLEQTLQANRAFAEAYGVELKLDRAHDQAMVVADPDRLVQVITNLVSNAAKFSARGGVVRVSIHLLDRRYRISVADRGPGIPEEFKERIFNKFAQADSSDTRQKGGTGLGLSIVREIVTRMGGTVSFDSVVGEGATFHVDLPAEQQRAPAAEPRPGQPHILHVEDDPDVLRVVASAFEGRAQLRSVVNLAEAREALRECRFALVILDVALPDGSGLDLLPALRQSWQAPVPVVVFSAQDAGPELSGAVDAVLTKSRASLQRLIDTVEKLLEPAKGEP
jgi:PAS domain S-box-containing protein